MVNSRVWYRRFLIRSSKRGRQSQWRLYRSYPRAYASPGGLTVEPGDPLGNPGPGAALPVVGDLLSEATPSAGRWHHRSVGEACRAPRDESSSRGDRRRTVGLGKTSLRRSRRERPTGWYSCGLCRVPLRAVIRFPFFRHEDKNGKRLLISTLFDILCGRRAVKFRVRFKIV